MSEVPVKVKWGKKSFDVTVNTAGTALEFKATLLSLTGVPVERQKVMAKGVWKGTLKDDADMSSFTFKPKQKVMLMGKAAEIPTGENRPDVVFIEDLSKEEKTKVGAVIPAGFRNLGNTCYMNSTLQCLRAVPELRKALATVPPARDNPHQWMATALGQTFAGADREAEVFAPIGFVQALRTTYPQFDEVDPQSHGHKQQDADELYNNVLTSLANTLRSPVPGVEFKGTNNVIDELFQIKFETTLKCAESDAEPPVVQQTSARKLVCNIDGGAGAAVQINFLPEGVKLGLDGTLEKRSEVLGRNATWTKSQRIIRLPKYLCVQFMRFYWKATPDNRDRAGVNCKMMRPVSFPIDNLDAYEFCAPALQKRLKVYRDKYAVEQLARLGGGKDGDESKDAAAAAPAAAPAPAAAAAASADDDVAMDEDDDLAAALAMSLEGSGAATAAGAGGAGAGTEDVADVKMEEDDDLLGSGIPAEFRGLYELFAVVSHKGRSASSGHYMGWVRNKGDDWYCFDDDMVSPCKTEHVKQLKGGGDWDMTYIVFYRAKE